MSFHAHTLKFCHGTHVRTATAYGNIVAVSMTAGVIGMWAFFGSNATAAKFYLYTWLPRYLVAVLSTIIAYGVAIKGSMPLLLIEVVRLLFFSYYLKVREFGSNAHHGADRHRCSSSCLQLAQLWTAVGVSTL